MGVYETVTLMGAISYIGMYPSLVAIPALWKFMLFEFDDDLWTEEVTKSLQALFLLLGVVVAMTYFYAYRLDSVVLMDVSVMQRIFWVSICVSLTALLGQDIFPHHNHFCMLMTAVDVSGGIAHGLAAPGGLSGVWGKLNVFFLFIGFYVNCNALLFIIYNL